MGNLDIDGRFQRFRDSLIKDAYDWTIGNGGKIDLQEAKIALEFTSVLYYNDVLGEVEGLSLSATPEEPDKVVFTYRTPEWCEDNSDYIEQGYGPEEHEVALDELSSNELYNILKTINL